MMTNLPKTTKHQNFLDMSLEDRELGKDWKFGGGGGGTGWPRENKKPD